MAARTSRKIVQMQQPNLISIKNPLGFQKMLNQLEPHNSVMALERTLCQIR